MSDSFYVIGLDKFNLFSMEYQYFWGEEGTFYEIVAIEKGDIGLINATRYNTLEEAKEDIDEIKRRYSEICIKGHDLIDEIVHGRDFNPDDIKVFKTHYVMKEIEV